MEEITRAEAFVQALGPWVVHIAEACSVLVIFYAVAQAFVLCLLHLVHRHVDGAFLTRTRLQFGSVLALGLEFLLATDILETVLAPSKDTLIQLAVIAVIRTGLNYFLGKELEAESTALAERPEEPVERPVAANAVP